MQKKSAVSSGKNERSTAERKYSILVVDDEADICQLLADFFTAKGYAVRHALNGEEALARIAESQPDLVISDIRMPVMDGIELFRAIRERYSFVKHILMTGYNVDEYLSLVRRHNIGNILVKGADFSLREIDGYVRSILTGDIFGLGRYFPGSRHQTVSIDSYARSEEVCSLIVGQFHGQHGDWLKMAIDELIANAVFHGVLQMTDINREQWREDIPIDPACAIKVTWACDAEKIGVAVEDPRGNLRKVDALRWLDQSDTSGRENEEHGRGLFLVRRFIDRFIINIDPGKRTECIILQYIDRDHLHDFKPLMIHEL